MKETRQESLRQSVEGVARAAHAAAPSLARASGAQREAALKEMAQSLRVAELEILSANAEDVESARARGVAEAMIDRLRLNAGRLEEMACALEEVAGLADPLGEVERMWTRPNGLRVGRRRIPLGVVAMIYEARPNVTSDAAGLCLKSGNAVVLKGGSEAQASNHAIVRALRAGLEAAELPSEVLGFVEHRERESVGVLLKCEPWIDLVIPRGGEGLIRFVSEHAKMPVLKHYKGVCHLYIDASAGSEMSKSIAINAKCQRPSVCNALETLLIHASALGGAGLATLEALLAEEVRLHVCSKTHKALGERSGVVAAEESDWSAEYLSADLAVRVVEDMDEALAHIRSYGSQHTEAIITESYEAAERFLEEVDSSTVLVNASTRFADGAQLGLGAEIGISTTKLHAFGPMGLKELTTTKFIVYGNGQVRV